MSEQATKPFIPRELWTAAELATYLGKPLKYVYRLTHERRIDHYVIGRLGADALTDYLGHFPRELHQPLKAVASRILRDDYDAAESDRLRIAELATQHMILAAQAAPQASPPDQATPWEWDSLSTVPVSTATPGLDAVVGTLNQWSGPVEWDNIRIEAATPAQQAFMAHFSHDELPDDNIRFAHALMGIRPGQTQLVHCNAPIFGFEANGIFRYTTPRHLLASGLVVLDLSAASEPLYQADDGYWYPVPAIHNAGYNAGYNGGGPRDLGRTVTWMLTTAKVGSHPSGLSDVCDLAENLLVKPGANRRIDRDELLVAAGLAR